MLQFIFTDLFPLSFPTRSEEDGDDDELKDATEDEEHADEHPDVKEGDVRDTRNILTNLEHVDESQIILSQCSYRAEHGGKSEKSRHPHPHPARDRFWGDEEGQPGKYLEDDDGLDNDDNEDILTTNTVEGI